MAIDLSEVMTPFAGLELSVLAELERAATEVHFQKGAAVFRQGDPGDALYILRSGALEVVAETPTGGRHRLETVVAGEWIGELSLLNDRPRAASVFALEDSSALRIPASVCRRVMVDPHAKQRLFAVASRRLPSRRLDLCPLFKELAPEVLATLDHHVQWVRLEGGEVLCSEGEPAEAAFVLVDGSMEVSVGSGSAERLVDILERGALIGEVATLANETRSATVRAIRDCDLIRIPRATFFQLLSDHSQIGINLARLLAARLRHTTRAPERKRNTRAIAVISATESPISEAFVAALIGALEPLKGRVRVIGSVELDAELGAGAACVAFGDDSAGRLSNWLDAQECSCEAIVYRCDPTASAWTLRALRQSDLLLVVARGDGTPSDGAFDRVLSLGVDVARLRPELVLLHSKDAQPSGTRRWLKHWKFIRHHHLRLGDAADFSRLARSINGSSVGLALSGGGARGFAHIGLLKALRERGIPIDSVGGTSMGAVIAGQVALGWEIARMIEDNRRAFTECAVIGDLTFPYVALLRGASTVQLLQTMFGDVQIEDLWLPYFCVSTNLSRAEVVVHDQGPLWLWVRSSSAVPGIVPPVPWRGDLLVDGGLLNNLPVDVLRQRCPGAAIASDASPAVDLTTAVGTCAEISGWPHLRRKLNPWSRAAAFPNVFEIMMRTVSMSGDHSLEQMKRAADLYLHPPLSGIEALDWGAIERIVEIGYRHACERLDAWDRTSASASWPTRGRA